MPQERDPDSVTVAVNRAVTAVIGNKNDYTGASNNFETDQPLGSTPSHYISLTIPGYYSGSGDPYPDITRFLLTDISFYFNAQTNNVSYQLRLFEGANANDYANRADIVFETPAALSAATTPTWARWGPNGRIVVGGSTKQDGQLPRIVNLATPPRLYYMIDWSGASGNVYGFIRVRGHLMK